MDVHTKELLEKMLENNDDKDFPADTVKRLLSLF